MGEEKVALLHPEGKNAPAISKDTYELFEKVIIEILKEQPLTYSSIAAGVRHRFLANKIGFKGSIEWYSVSVKQHLEAVGIIEAYKEKGRKMHRLKH